MESCALSKHKKLSVVHFSLAGAAAASSHVGVIGVSLVAFNLVTTAPVRGGQARAVGCVRERAECDDGLIVSA